MPLAKRSDYIKEIYLLLDSNPKERNLLDKISLSEAKYLHFNLRRIVFKK